MHLIQPPSIPPVKVFRATSTEFTTHQIASDRQRYIGCELDADGRVVFLLEDPHDIGAEDLRQFQRGISRHLPVHYVFEIRSFLLNEIKMKTGGVDRGKNYR